MYPPRIRLAIDIGVLTTVAALDRDGHRTAVVFGDRVTVPTRTVDQDRDVMTALASSRGDQAEPVIVAIAEHLQMVVSHTGSVDAAVLTTPPSWGPRQQEMLIRAAHRAGLPTTEVISEAAAVATRLFPDAPRDALVLVCHLGQRSSHATVVQRHQDGWVRVATQPMPATTGDRLDHLLAEQVTGNAVGDDVARQVTGNAVGDDVARQVAQARGQLVAGNPAAFVASDHGAPISVSLEDVEAAARLLRHTVADSLADTLDAAGVDPHQLYGTVVYGEEADLLTPPTAGDERPGMPITAAADGRLTAVYGALKAVAGAAPTAEAASAAGALRAGWGRYGHRLVAPLLAALAGGLLLWQTFEIVQRLMPPQVYRLPSDYEKLSAYFDTAAFAVCGWVLALVCVAAGRNVAAVLLQEPAVSGARKAGQVYAFSALVGLAVAVLQGLLAQAVIGGPAAMAPPYLTSAVVGAIVPTGIAIVVGLASPWLHGQPAWTERVHYPISSVVLAAVGILALRARIAGLPVDGVPGAVTAVLGVGGAALLGVAIGVTLVTHRQARFILGALLAAACMMIIDVGNLHSTIVIYLIAVGLWWIRRASRIAADSAPHRWRQAVARNLSLPAGERHDQ